MVVTQNNGRPMFHSHIWWRAVLSQRHLLYRHERILLLPCCAPGSCAGLQPGPWSGRRGSKEARGRRVRLRRPPRRWRPGVQVRRHADLWSKLRPRRCAAVFGVAGMCMCTYPLVSSASGALRNVRFMVLTRCILRSPLHFVLLSLPGHRVEMGGTACVPPYIGLLTCASRRASGHARPCCARGPAAGAHGAAAGAAPGRCTAAAAAAWRLPAERANVSSHARCCSHKLVQPPDARKHDV